MARNLNSPSKKKIVHSKVLDDVFSNQPEEDDDGTFSFETDYLALKGNPDYLKLMRTLVVLQAQRTKILQDINHLEELKSRADSDPEGVKELILKGDAPFLQRIVVEKVPEIDWSKYRTYNPGDRISRRNKTDRSVPVKIKKENEGAESNGPVKVRGRAYHEKKPETFNQLWTVEEQLRLEQLLEEYPPEPIENRRWKKIAAALGNRTTKQVCSRVQKYFQKLQKAGISAPGIARTRSNRAAHVHKRHKHLLYKPTTFFPGVAMGELSSGSDDEERTVVGSDSHDDLAHWKDILKKIETSKKADDSDDDESTVIEHHGFKCGVCGQNPVKGFRWECRTCPSFSSCNDCMQTIPKKSPPPHPLTHHFRLLEEAIFMPEMNRLIKKGNYLDPSYMH
uniref:ZZ-type zinc finger-containing protein 3 n=2 Tax=Lygus hesperus TaxID=30085 RepID=A0A146L2J3_LYGHE